jgi:iron complex transport system substrate-binding protein
MGCRHFSADPVWPGCVKSVFAALVAVACVCSCSPAEQTDPAPEPDSIRRIVTLAPNLTELVFAAGAGELLVGVSAYSDFPPEALELPVVSDAFTVDQEQLALLKPDLLLAWQSGTPVHVVDELRAAGFNIEAITTRGLDDVPVALERIGRLTGHNAEARVAAENFRQSIEDIRRQYSDASEVSVFYQVSARPLYTINREHFIGEILSLCGGRNIFADLSELAPSVSVEAVIDRDPEVLLAAGDSGEMPFADWQRWDSLAANRYGNHFVVGSAEIGRATPRLLLAAQQVCVALLEARANREAVQEQDREQAHE